jgi:DNA replication protein DnaC
MNDLGKPIADAITNMIRLPSDQEHVCPFCNQVVPKMHLNVMGIEKVIQPYCPCEVRNWESGITEAAELHKNKEIERKFSVSSLGERFANSTFDAFQIREGAENAEQYARQYASNFPNYGGDALLIHGEPGNGKSHLSAAVCHEIKARGYIPVFQSVPELLERIRNTFGSGKKESEKEIMSALLECHLLVLDDIGAEKISDWVQDVLFRIIDGRYRQKRPIFYTSNLKPSELKDKLGARIFDRMMETTLQIENKASSYRMQVAKERIARMRGMGE